MFSNRSGLCKWLLLCLLWNAFCVDAYELPEEKQALHDKITQNPLEVVELVNAALNEQKLSTKDEAELQYILTDAYYAAFLGTKALDAGRTAVEKSAEAGLEELKQWSNSAVARVHEITNQPEAGIPFAEEALAWAKANQNIALQVNATISLGSLYLTNSEYSLSLEHFNNAYRLAQEFSHKPGVAPPAHVASFIALVHEYRRESELAIPYFEESTAYYREVDNQVELSNSLYGLGKAYRELNKIEQALIYYNESMDISVQIGDRQGAAYTAHELATIKLKQPNLTEDQRESIKLEIEATIRTFEDGQNYAMLVNSKLLLTDWYTRIGDYKAALEVANSAWDVSQRYGITPQDISIVKTQAFLRARLGDFQQAYELLSLHNKKENALRQKTDADKYQMIRAEFELDQKDYQNKLLAAQNAQQQAELNNRKQAQIIVVLVVVVLAILFFAIVLLYVGAKRQQKLTEKLAQTDELTGLYNRRQTMALLEREKKLAYRQKHQLSVAIADIDDFKMINDDFGHPVGDEVLRFVAAKIKDNFRETDIIGRIGGEEFLFVFPASTQQEVKQSLEHFMKECQKLPDSLARHTGLTVGFSVGLTAADDNRPVPYTLAKADALMYRAKENGKAQVVMDNE